VFAQLAQRMASAVDMLVVQACKRSAVRARLAPPRSEALLPVAGEGLLRSEGHFEGKITVAPCGLPRQQDLLVGCAVIPRPVSARERVSYPLRSVTHTSVRPPWK
jgi:hypothetical protein